jgi:hypothetical protein
VVLTVAATTIYCGDMCPTLNVGRYGLGSRFSCMGGRIWVGSAVRPRCRILGAEQE